MMTKYSRAFEFSKMLRKSDWIHLRRFGSKTTSRDFPPSSAYFFSSNLGSISKSHEQVIDSDLVAKNLSPSVLATMIKESIQQKDYKTSNMLIKQAILVGDEGTQIISDFVSHFLKTKNFLQIARTFVTASQNGTGIAPELSQQCLTECVSHFQWRTASTIVNYMVVAGIDVSDKVLMLTVAGLMSEKQGVIHVITLLTTMIEKNREDLMSKLHYANVSIFFFVIFLNVFLHFYFIDII